MCYPVQFLSVRLDIGRIDELKKRTKRKVRIINDLRSIRETLNDPTENKTNTDLKIKYLYNDEESYKIKNLFCQFPHDRTIIENLYNALDKRKNDIKSKYIIFPKEKMIADDNTNCLSLVEDMMKIDWAKYPANAFDD